MNEIAFSLPFALESLNVRDRKSHWQRSRGKRDLSLEVLAAIGGSRYLPRPPFERARITIVRCSSQRLDPDGLPAVAKNLLDVLCVKSNIHPTGLGVIVDDSPRHIELTVTQSTAPPSHGSTLVRIEKLSVPTNPRALPSSPTGQ